MTLIRTLFVILLTLSSVGASPTFSPRAALNWCRETVVSPIPTSSRIYVLGPDKTKEAYGLNGDIGYHDLEVRQAVEFKTGMTLTDLFAYLPQYKDQTLRIIVWRASLAVEPIPIPSFSNSLSEATRSTIPLERDDIVQIIRHQGDIIIP